MLIRLIVFLVACTSAASTWADENWPQFRGPNGSGVSASQHPPIEIQQDSLLRWKVAVPKGVSSSCIWGKRIFLTAFDDGKLWTLAYDRGDGHLLWKMAAAAKEIEKFHPIEGSPAASTCATDGQRVVSYFGSCGLVCYDLDGHLLWSYELPTAETNFDFGTGTSPIIADGMAILVRDLKSGSMALAVDLTTGKERWKTERPTAPTAFSTPTVTGQGNDAARRRRRCPSDEGLRSALRQGAMADPGVTGRQLHDADHRRRADVFRRLVAWRIGRAISQLRRSSQALSTRITDGALEKEELEKTPLKNFFDNNDTNHDGKITRDEWENNYRYLKLGKNSLFAFSPKGEGDVTDTAIAWKQTKGLPYVPSPLYYRGRIYLIRDGGLVSSFDAETGKPFYESKRLGTPGSYYASPIAAAGHIYFVSLSEGVVSVIKAESDSAGGRGTAEDRRANRRHARDRGRPSLHPQ